MFEIVSNHQATIGECAAITRIPSAGCTDSMSAESKASWMDPVLSEALKRIQPTRILFLADAPNHENNYSLVDEYWNLQGRLLKACTAVSSDFNFTRTLSQDLGGDNHITDLKLNNLDTLPAQFKSTFDLVVGRALICWCPSSSVGACGLPTADFKVGAKFLRRVGKLLKPANKEAAVYLHGYAGGSKPESIEFWTKACTLAAEKKDFDITLVMWQSYLSFIRIKQAVVI